MPNKPVVTRSDALAKKPVLLEGNKPDNNYCNNTIKVNHNSAVAGDEGLQISQKTNSSSNDSTGSKDSKKIEKLKGFGIIDAPVRKFEGGIDRIEKAIALRRAEILAMFSKRLDLQLSKMDALENAKKAREEFIRRVDNDLEDQCKKPFDAWWVRGFRTTALIDDYPFLAEFRESFAKSILTEQAGAFHHAVWQCATAANWDEAFNIFRKPAPATMTRHKPDYDRLQKRRLHEALNGKIVPRGEAEIYDQTGRIVFYCKIDGYGFLESDRGYSYYFHSSRVDQQFRRLTVAEIIPRYSAGQRVKFDTYFEKSPHFENNEAVNIRPLGREKFLEEYAARDSEVLEECSVAESDIEVDCADLSFDV